MTPAQAACAALVGRGHTYPEIAGMLNMSRRTIGRWMAEPEIRAEADAARASVNSRDWTSILFDAMTRARKDDGVDWPSRISAAKALSGIIPAADAAPPAPARAELYDFTTEAK